MEKSYIDYIDAINSAQSNAEVNVLAALTSAYAKQAIMLEECAEDYPGLTFIQEGEVLDKAKGDKSESMLKRILLFIPRLIKALWEKVFKKQKASGVKSVVKQIETAAKSAEKSGEKGHKIEIVARWDFFDQNGSANKEMMGNGMLGVSGALGEAMAPLMVGEDPDNSQLKIIGEAAPDLAKRYNEFVDKYEKVEPKKYTADISFLYQMIAQLQQLVQTTRDKNNSAVKVTDVRLMVASILTGMDEFGGDAVDMLKEANEVLNKMADKSDVDKQLLTRACEGLAQFIQGMTRFSVFTFNETKSVYMQIYKQLGGSSIDSRKKSTDDSGSDDETSDNKNSVKVSDEVKEWIANKDTHKLRIILPEHLRADDPQAKGKFAKELSLCGDWVYEPYKPGSMFKDELTKPESQWDRTYWTRLYAGLRDNFAKERIDRMIAVARKLNLQKGGQMPNSGTSKTTSKTDSDSKHVSPDIIPSKTTSYFDDVKGKSSAKAKTIGTSTANEYV